jgi:urease accessory protein
MKLESFFARCRSMLPASLLVMFAGTASAHPGHAVHDLGGIGWGLRHPFTGLDHLLTMVAVGLWAIQLGGRAVWMLPLSFLGAMIAGAAAGMTGFMLPQIEPMILGSVLALGAMVAISIRMPLAVSVSIVAAIAFLHGQAHGAELPTGAIGWLAGAGFAAATAALHAVGLAGGAILRGVATRRALRGAGALIALAAVLLGLDVF